MVLSMLEKINSRVSVRTYADKKLSPADKINIRQLLESLPRTGPFGNTTRFELIDVCEHHDLSTYGFIKGASQYFGGLIKMADKAMEDYGYCFERAVLELSGLGYGTCWIAGSFNRKAFAASMGAREGEVLPAVSPVGYPGEKVSLRDSIIKFAAGSRTRKEWSQLFFIGDTGVPLTKEDAGQYALSLEAVRRGPSGANRQPWRIVKQAESDIFHFFMIKSRANSDIDIQRIGMGIAMFHFESVALEAGLKGTWKQKDTVSMADLEYIVSWMNEDAR